MYTHSGELKVNKKDIEAIRTFLHHAREDMDYGPGGSYTHYEHVGEDIDKKEFAKGKHGLACIEFMLEALCPKWTK